MYNLSCLELQKSKEREERLEEVVQAYEKIHLEKSNVQRDLDKMVNTHTHTPSPRCVALCVELPCVCQTSLAEQHVQQICSLESALRQREASVQKVGAQLRRDTLQLHASLDVPRGGSHAQLAPTDHGWNSYKIMNGIGAERVALRHKSDVEWAESISWNTFLLSN